MSYSVGDFIQDGERWVIPYSEDSKRINGLANGEFKAVVDYLEGNAGKWRYCLYGQWIGARETSAEAKARAVVLLNAPEIFCHHPAKCTAAGRCTREMACND